MSRPKHCVLLMASRDSHSHKVSSSPLVSVIMGSRSDWETMSAASEMLTQFGVPHENRIISAHRTPELMAEFAAGAPRVAESK